MSTASYNLYTYNILHFIRSCNISHPLSWLDFCVSTPFIFYKRASVRYTCYLFILTAMYWVKFVKKRQKLQSFKKNVLRYRIKDFDKKKQFQKVKYHRWLFAGKIKIMCGEINCLWETRFWNCYGYLIYSYHELPN